MKFSIRDLLLVTVIVALAVGWWVDRFRLTTEYNRLRRLLSENWQGEYEPSAIYYEGGDTEVIVLPNSSALAPNPTKP